MRNRNIFQSHGFFVPLHRTKDVMRTHSGVQEKRTKLINLSTNY